MNVPDDTPAHTERARPDDELLGRSLALVRFLREGCPWDARQTPESLRPYLLEEAHETADAVLRGEDEELAGELGDLLLNIAFQIVLAEERGAFGPLEVVRRLEAKMEARHPHVYGDADEPPDWEEMKARERTPGPDGARAAEEAPDSGRGAETRAREGGDTPAAGEAAGPDPGTAPPEDDPSREGPPAGLEPLSRALRVQQRAAALGFEWPSVGGALDKLREEAAEVEALLERRGPVPPADAGADGEPRRERPAPPDGADTREGEATPGRPPAAADPAAEAGGTVPDGELEEEVGDLLLAAVTVARHASVHPMRALERATRTFERRFRELVRRADEAGLDLREASVEEMEDLWGRLKAEER